MSSANEILQRTAHRPWPPPQRPWRWSQGWKDLLFCHWAVPAESLRSHVPSCLEIDTKDGSAWVSAVAFHMTGVRPRRLPAMPPVSDFLELNLRSYVRWEDKPGVFFLSIHASKRLAVRVAKWFSPLPYSYARMRWNRQQQEHRFVCAGELEPIFDARYTTTSQAFAADQGSLDEWLLERYCLYLSDRTGGLISAEVHHEPWSVKKVDVRASSNALGKPFGLDLSSSPDRVHYSPGVEALAWPFEIIKPELVTSCP